MIALQLGAFALLMALVALFSRWLGDLATRALDHSLGLHSFGDHQAWKGNGA